MKYYYYQKIIIHHALGADGVRSFQNQPQTRVWRGPPGAASPRGWAPSRTHTPPRGPRPGTPSRPPLPPPPPPVAATLSFLLPTFSHCLIFPPLSRHVFRVWFFCLWSFSPVFYVSEEIFLFKIYSEWNWVTTRCGEIALVEDDKVAIRRKWSAMRLCSPFRGCTCDTDARRSYAGQC